MKKTQRIKLEPLMELFTLKAICLIIVELEFMAGDKYMGEPI